MFRLWIHIALILCTSLSAAAQCTSGGAEWLNGANNGNMRDTGLLGGYVTVEAATTGTMVSGRPLYQAGSSLWKGLTYASLQVFRAYSSPGSNSTSFKLSVPLDSTYFHARVDNIRGDNFNWESQNVRGYLNGVEVPAVFKDPVNGATVSGNTVIGASYTTSTVQSAMRIFFTGPVDSIVVRQTSWSDWIIAELLVQCNVLLPVQLTRWQAARNGKAVDLNWSSAPGAAQYVLERSRDGRSFSPIALFTGGNARYTFRDNDVSGEKLYYRIRMEVSGRAQYSTVLLVRETIAPALIYPNPFQHRLHIDLPANMHAVEVFSGDGKLIGCYKGKGIISIETSHWMPGLYFIRAEGDLVRKVMKLK